MAIMEKTPLSEVSVYFAMMGMIFFSFENHSYYKYLRHTVNIQQERP